MYSLETSSHILQLFPVPRSPYYALIDRAHPTDYTITALTSKSALSADNGNDDPEIRVFLNKSSIGEISATNPSPLADFLLYWKQSLSTLPEYLERSASSDSTNSLPDAANPAAQSERLKSYLIKSIEPLKTTFLEQKQLRIRTVTWNIHAEPLPKANINSLLGLPTSSSSDKDKPFDLYIIAIQESDQLGPKNLYANQSTLSATQDYIVQTLGGPNKYLTVASNQLLGILLLVVAATPLVPHLSNFYQDTTGTGIFGIWGNKGAALISFFVGQDLAVGQQGTQISILNCHLAHGEGIQGIERRRWELSEIQKKLQIPGLVGKRQPLLIFSNSTEDSESSDKVSISDKNEEKEEEQKKPEDEDDTTSQPLTPISDDDSIIVKPGDDEDDDEDCGDVDSLPPSPAAPLTCVEKPSSVSSSIASPVLLEDTDPFFTFVLGDLNYRVALDPQVVVDLVEQEDFDTILTHDRLSTEHKRKRILPLFKEGNISFAPTYKYAIGTDDFDDSMQSGSSSATGTKKARAPSYTDRIFYSSSAPSLSSSLELTKYTSLTEYTLSDHKPVIADFGAQVDIVDPEKRKAAVAKVLKEADDKENLSKPSVTVTPREVTVRDAVVLQESEGTIAVKYLPNENVPDKVLRWKISFAPDASESGESSDGPTAATTFAELTTDIPKLSIEPQEGVLPPGATQYIKFSCTLPIGKGTSSTVRFAVLNIVDTQDIFVPVEFTALPTSLGTSLDVLSRLPKGARSGYETMTDDSSVNMPKEIWSCVDYLWQNIDKIYKAKDTEEDDDLTETASLFFEDSLQRGEPSLQFQIQEWLDFGQDFDPLVLEAANEIIAPDVDGKPRKSNLGIYSVAAQFLLLLQYLDGSIVPEEFYSFVLKGREGALYVLERAPRVNVNVLLYVSSFLKLLLDKEQKAKAYRARKREEVATALKKSEDGKTKTRPKSLSFSKRFTSSFNDALDAVNAVGASVVEAGQGVSAGLSNLKIISGNSDSTPSKNTVITTTTDDDRDDDAATANISLSDAGSQEDDASSAAAVPDPQRARELFAFIDPYIIAKPKNTKETRATKNARLDFLAELVGV